MMIRRSKKAICMMIAGIMMLTDAGASVYAMETTSMVLENAAEIGTSYAKEVEYDEKMLFNSGDEKKLGNFTYVENETGEITITAYTGNEPIVDVASVFAGKNVTQIGRMAFNNNQSIVKAILPSTLKIVGELAFGTCKNLKSVTFNGTPNLISIEGRAFYITALSDFTIPSTVVQIGERAFQATNLTSVTIPASCMGIEDQAFQHCKKLKEVIFEENSQLDTIGDRVFYETSLSDIIIPESCSTVGTGAFALCPLLKTIQFKNKDTVNATTNENDYPSEVRILAEPGGEVERHAKNLGIRFNRYAKNLSITTSPSKTEYLYGEKLDLTGLVVTADFVSAAAPQSAVVDTSSCSIIGYDPEAVGKQTITVEYGGQKTSFDVTVYYDMSKADVDSIDSHVYTGNPIRPEVKAKGYETRMMLVNGRDYTVDYSEDHTNARTVTVTLIGIGNYKGQVTTEFVITPKMISDSDIKVTIPEVVYSGKAQEAEMTIIYGDKKLAAGTDYMAEYTDNVNAGTASVKITGIGNYTSYTYDNFTIKPKSLKKAKITLAKTSMSYTGKALKSSVKKVVLDGVTLKAGKDYKVTYKNNKNIGKATVTIEGIGNYEKTASASFNVKVKKGSKFTVNKYIYKIISDSTVEFAGIKDSKATKVTIPATVKIGGKSFKVTSVASKALYKNKKVKSVVIGKNVTKIGTSAFEKCSKLSAITIKSANLKSVGSKAFKGIKSNAKIKVPSKKLNAYKKVLKNKGQGKNVKIQKA